MQAAIYVRVSTDKQEAENQLLQLREFCVRKGWEIYNEYVDIISGKETSRPGFNSMLDAARRREFDVLVFWDLSRFSRAGTKHTIDILYELKSRGVDYVSYQESLIDSTNANPFSDVIISIMSTLAKIEREKISARTKAGLDRVKKQGKKLGRPRRKINFKRVWEEYEKQGSINKAAKVLPYSKGVVHFIIKNDIHDQDAYEQLRAAGGQKKGDAKSTAHEGENTHINKRPFFDR